MVYIARGGRRRKLLAAEKKRGRCAAALGYRLSPRPGRRCYPLTAMRRLPGYSLSVRPGLGAAVVLFGGARLSAATRRVSTISAPPDAQREQHGRQVERLGHHMNRAILENDVSETRRVEGKAFIEIIVGDRRGQR